jgi:naringenin degradation protein FdeH
MPGSIRRIVTGKNAEGKSTIAEDTVIAAIEPFGLQELWTTRLEPPPGGTLFRFFEIRPQQARLTAQEVTKLLDAAFAALGASDCRIDTHRHPLMHRTHTIDYVVLLRGQATLILDEGEVDLKPLDVVVQGGTNHAWVATGGEPALFMAVLVDGGQ